MTDTFAFQNIELSSLITMYFSRIRFSQTPTYIKVFKFFYSIQIIRLNLWPLFPVSSMRATRPVPLTLFDLLIPMTRFFEISQHDVLELDSQRSLLFWYGTYIFVSRILKLERKYDIMS